MGREATQILSEVFGYRAFRGLQKEIIESACEGRDALVLMPTGGGKSLCFQIPALVRPGVAVVISPLIALMADQVATLRQLGVRAEALNSTLSSTDQADIERRLRSGEIDLLYLAPERALQPRTAELLGELPVALIAIDEAHCVSQWGHDFRPEYMQLAALADRIPDAPRMALTATADGPTRREIVTRLGLRDPGEFIASFDRPNITYRVAERQGGKQQLLRFLEEQHRGDAGIVYCLSRRSVEETAEWLTARGIPAYPYHAGLDSELRQRHQTRFLNEEGQVIVATIAFGMGIDKPNVRFVAHLDLPGSVEAYYQETGRAGRDGLPATAWMVYGLSDLIRRRSMLEESESGEQRKRVERAKLDALLGYCELSSCRRVALLGYFGEELAAPCGNCDNCLDPPDTWDATEAARMALSAIYRTGQRFGVGQVVDVLRGKTQEKVERWGHDRLSVFGVGRDHSEAEWRTLLRQLVARGLVDVDVDGYGTLHLNDSCRPLLRGETNLELRRPVKKTRKAARKTAAPVGLDAEQRRVFESLRETRLDLAHEQGVPPYVIFHDATLQAMVVEHPETLAELAEIPGVGAKKLERYGEIFLGALQEALAEATQ
ncbi:MAG: DNA helicase RecQ [Xanthomonadales bacterium]|nr:DNA helicase RecQ [Xanthomonadales bacterium]